MMMLSIDNLANRYGCLPSEAIERGSTFDFKVMDISAKWAKYNRDKAEVEADGGVMPSKMPTQEDMKAMIARAKEKQDASSKKHNDKKPKQDIKPNGKGTREGL